MDKLYRITIYLGDEQLGSPLYLTDSDNDQKWWNHFLTTSPGPTRRVFETFVLESSEEVLPYGRP
jgi:hypothetical protein